MKLSKKIITCFVVTLLCGISLLILSACGKNNNFNLKIHFYQNVAEERTITLSNDTLVKDLEKPTLQGYTFTGWFKDENCNQVYSANEIITKETETIYAKMATINTITYHLDGGVNSSEHPNQYVSGISYSLYSPTKENFIFVGWYKDNAFQNKITGISRSSNGNLDLYARFASAEELLVVENGKITGLTEIGQLAERITIPQKINNVTITTIGSNAFYHCFNTKYISLPNTISTLENNAFHSSGVKEVNLPEGIKIIPLHAFSYCSNLENINIPSTVTQINMFAFESTGLKSIFIPANVTQIDYTSFTMCNGLEEVNVDERNSVFHSKDNCLIKTAEKTLLLGCKNSIIPTDESVTNIGNYAFYGCKEAERIIIPNNIQSIGAGAFFNCYGITSITLPQGITRIEYSTFYSCQNLKTIILPSSLTFIHPNSFRGSKIENIYFQGSQEQFNELTANIPSEELNLSEITVHYNYNFGYNF